MCSSLVLTNHRGCADCNGSFYSEPPDHRGARTLLTVHDNSCPFAGVLLPDRQPREAYVEGHRIVDMFDEHFGSPVIVADDQPEEKREQSDD